MVVVVEFENGGTRKLYLRTKCKDHSLKHKMRRFSQSKISSTYMISTVQLNPESYTFTTILRMLQNWYDDG